MTRWTDENAYQGRTDKQIERMDATTDLLARVAVWAFVLVCIGMALHVAPGLVDSWMKPMGGKPW